MILGSFYVVCLKKMQSLHIKIRFKGTDEKYLH